MFIKIILLFIFTFPLYAQYNEWKYYSDPDLGISFEYPSYYELSFDYDSSNNKKLYLAYEFLDSSFIEDYSIYRDSTIQPLLSIPSFISIEVSDKNFSRKANELGFIPLLIVWCYTMPESTGTVFEANIANYGDWFGLLSYQYPISYYFKEGGSLTRAGEREIILLHKEISGRHIYTISEGRHEDYNGNDILDRLIPSMSIRDSR